MSIDKITLNVLSNITKNINPSNEYKMKNKTLIVFTGSNMDLESRIKTLKSLRENTLYDVAFSFMSENIIDKDRILLELQPQKVFREEDIFDLDIMTEEYNCLICPNITVNTISKVSNGIIDSFVPIIIWTFLYKGKNVFLDYEGARNYLGGKTKNEILRKIIMDKIDVLTDMGAIELTNGNYREKIMASRKVKETSKNSNTKYESVDGKKVITSSDIEALPSDILVLGKDDIITPLAKDKARELNVEIKINN